MDTRSIRWAVILAGLATSGLCFSLWLILLSRYPAGRLATIAFLTRMLLALA